MTYRELHYPGDVTADLVPGEQLGWDVFHRTYVIVQSYYSEPMAGRDFAIGDTPPPGRTTVVLQGASPDDVRRWTEEGTWHPEAVYAGPRSLMLLSARRAELREAARA